MSDEIPTTIVTTSQAAAPADGAVDLNAKPIFTEPIPDATPTPEPDKQKDEFASKFAALSRAEKRTKQREADISKKAAEVQKAVAEFERQQRENADKYKSLEQKQAELATRLKNKPLKTLKEEFGLSFDDLTKFALADDNPTPDMLIKNVREELESKYSKQIDDLRSEYLTSEKKKAEDEFKNKEQQYLNNLTAEINGNEKYELIKANDAIGMIYDLQNEAYNTSGRILSNTEAADLVEAHLEEGLEKLIKLNKVQSKLGAQKPKEEQSPKKTDKPSVTLSNANSQVAPKSERKLSDSESKALAAKLLKWNE